MYLKKRQHKVIVNCNKQIDLIEIMDAIGRVVKTQKKAPRQQSPIRINTEELSSGVYSLRIFHNGE